MEAAPDMLNLVALCATASSGDGDRPRVGNESNPFAHYPTHFFYPNRVNTAWKGRAERTGGLKLATSGLQWDELGVVFPPMWDFASAQMQSVVEPALMSGDAFQQGAQRVIMEQVTRRRPSRAEFTGTVHVEPLLDSLERDGFARFGPELGFRSLLEQSGLAQHVARMTSGLADGATAIFDLPGVEPVVDQLIDTVGHLVLHYMGIQAEIEGFSAYRLGAKVATPPNYRAVRSGVHVSRPVTSTIWHHDRCGRRLKAYIFLQDVTHDTHPTEIVPGSHRTTYYSYGEYTESRFDAEFIQKRYNTTPMLGGLGDGFVFDTNAIHRGRPGNHGGKRDVLLFEFNVRSELRKFHQLGTNYAPGEFASTACKATALFPRHVNSNFSLDRIRHRRGLGAQRPVQDAQSVENSPLAPFNATHYSFDEQTAAASCVKQKLSTICPARASSEMVCVPIEPVRELHHWKVAKSKDFGHASWIADSDIMYKPEVLTCPPTFQNLFYVDLGAEHYPSSVGAWFRTRYPNHERFKVIAFEADPFKNGVRGGATWRQRRDVEMLPFGVWTKNSTIEFLSEGFGAHLTGDQNLSALGSKFNLKQFGNPKQRKHVVQVPTIDISEFLLRRVREDDYVVLKMDVEGAEFQLIPHLISTGATSLIDEIYVEVHAPSVDGGEDPRKPLVSGRTRHDAKELVSSLRRAGVYAHQWA